MLEISRKFVSNAKDLIMEKINDKKVADIFENCINNTLDATIKMNKDKSAFIITGDIPAIILQLASQKYPIVIIDRMFEGIPISWVWSNNTQGSKLLVEHLFEKGHKNIALIGSRSYVSTIKARKEGFIEAFAGLKMKYKEENIIGDIKSVLPTESHRGYEKDMEYRNSML